MAGGNATTNLLQPLPVCFPDFDKTVLLSLNKGQLYLVELHT